LTVDRDGGMSRELTTDLAVLERLVAPSGKDVLDVGCGAGRLVRQLTERGARVVGLEVSAEQLAPALAADDGLGARYEVGVAQALPFADASVDVVVFMRSLHHLPVAEQTPALREARRVLRAGGVVYAAEPLPEGNFYELTRLVEDELEVRRAAQRALAGAAEVGLVGVTTVEYEIDGRYPDVEAFRALMVGAEPERAPIFEARAEEIAQTFARLGEPTGEGDGRRFRQPLRADLLRADS
jgi:SAM-dependent methyltransferase